MFFNITPTVDTRFPNNINCNWAVFNCDNGWKKFDVADGVIFGKGYANRISLDELINYFEFAHTYDGNFCLVKFNKDSFKITHSKYRSFPLAYSNQTVTNLYIDNLMSVWANQRITVDNNWKIDLLFDTIIQPYTQLISIDQAVDQIFQLLIADLTNFVKNNKPNIKLFCSGGVDTTLLYALFRHINYPVELITNEHLEEDNFIKFNHTQLNKFWGYSQMHHWLYSTWLATGSCGDEYLLRGPAVISMLTAWHDINFSEILNNSPTHYHYYHFKKYQSSWDNDWQNRNNLKHEYPTIDRLHRQILNILSNDHQHWHLGNTMTYTLFNNLELVKILLQVNINDLVAQFTDAAITKSLIHRVNPELCSAVSTYKNYNNQENLNKLLIFHQKLSH